MVTYGHVTEGYEYPMIKFTVMAETDIFGQTEKKRERGKNMKDENTELFRTETRRLCST